MANVKATDLIDFTRASKGHALAKVSYGTELVVNGSFDTDSGWIKTQATISGGVCEINSPSGSYAGVYQAIPVTAGKMYFISVEVVSVVAGSALVNVEGGSVGTLTTAGFITTAYVATDDTLTVEIKRGGGVTELTIDNVSVKEVTFDQPDGTIQLFEHPNNTPRIEYDSDGNLLGLLIEEARTNTIQYSEDFENSYWGKGGGFSIYGNNGIAPDGTRTATLITDVDEDSYMVRGGGVASNGQTKSIWARTVSGTGKVTLLKHNSVSAALFDLTEEWQRFELPVDISESGGASFYAIDFRASGTTLTEAYIWGAQLETGGFATSYIRSNSGSSTSRSADVASIDVDQFGYNQSEGTLLIQASSSNDTPSFAALSDTTASNRMLSYVSASNIRWYVVDGGTAQANIASGISYSEGDSYKIANAYKADDFAINVNGETSVTDTLGSVSSGVSILNIGTSNSGGAPLNGHIKSITYTPKRLSNAKLQELTS